MCSKKCFMLCVVLVLVLASATAWPVAIKKPVTIVEAIKTNPTESSETSEEILKSSTESSELTVETPAPVVPELDEDIVELDSRKSLKGADYEEFKTKYIQAKTDVYDLMAKNDELVADNTALLKEKKSKFFADLGLAFGFENKALMYGFAGDIGMRFGSSLMGKLGATYMFGSFSDIKNIGWNIDKLTVSATVGWEW